MSMRASVVAIPERRFGGLDAGMSEQKILVTGATGKTGSRVRNRLEDLGVPVRAAARTGEIPFDWSIPATWGPVLDGVSGLYLVVPHLGGPQAARDVAAFSRQAAAAGARKAVLVSFPDTGDPSYQHVLDTERALSEAGLEAAVLRMRWLFQNFSEDFLHASVLAGDLRLPAGNGREAFVDALDVADVAVAALTTDGHTGQVHELSGPRLMSFADAVAAIAQATGRPLTYTPLTPQQYAAEQRAHGVPEEWVDLTIGLYAQVRDGGLNTLTPDIEKILGRPARDFTDYAHHAAQAGAWNSRPTPPAER
ncbi:hypothetical protein ACU635_59430 [[Actinomadura] parvosata]|uniref:hypothetical protein n=1 Tax=[Actinomadura] parvosata TaxID=1955412 RepID=UPI00406BEFC0